MASFTSVLHKIGTVILDGSRVFSEVMNFPFLSSLLGQASPKVATVVTTATSDLNSIAQIISMAEAMYPAVAGSKTGAQKLTAAAPLVQQAILVWAQSNLPGHSKVLDPVKLSNAAATITAGFADALNSFGE